MKKYFLFDDEPIIGNHYFVRYLIGMMTSVILIGFWLLAATTYKRAGALNWTTSARIVCVLFIIIAPISSALNQDPGYLNSDLNLFDFLSILGGLIHLTLWFTNGNKKIKI